MGMSMERWTKKNLENVCRWLWMNQSSCSLGFLSQNSLWKLSTFRGYKGIYSRVWVGMWKVIFSKIGCFRDSLATGASRKNHSWNTRMPDYVLLSCDVTASLTLQLPACFSRVLHFCESSTRELVATCFCLHPLDQIFKLSHTSLTYDPT